MVRTTKSKTSTWRSTNNTARNATATTNLTTAETHFSSTTSNYEFFIVIAFICSIALVVLLIILVIVLCLRKWNNLDSSFSEDSKSAKAARRGAKKHRKKKVKPSSLVVVGNQLSPSSGQGSKAAANQHSKPSNVSRGCLAPTNLTKSKGTVLVGGGKQSTAAAVTPSGPRLTAAARPSKQLAMKARPLSKQGLQRKARKASPAIAPPPLDTRFGTLDPKLLIDIDIDQPSKSALDSNTSSITGVSVYSQNISVGTSTPLKRSSMHGKVSTALSKQQQHKRHRKHKKTG